MCLVKAVIIAPSPLVQVAMLAGCERLLWLRVPVVDPVHYLACCGERLREMAEEARDG